MPRPIHQRITPPPELTVGQRNDLTVLLKRTDTSDPDESDLVELRAYFQRYPELWNQVGSLAYIVRDEILSRVTTSPVLLQAMNHVADEMRLALTLPTDSAIEHLLIEHCITAHLLHYTLLGEYTALDTTELTPEDIAYWERRLTVSENRFLRNVETLARVRNLAFPILQLNITSRSMAKQPQPQTNIASGAPVEPPSRIIHQPASSRPKKLPRTTTRPP